MAWIYLLIAGLLEVRFGAYAMKQSQGFTRSAPSLVTIAAMFASFGLLAVSMKSLPPGTAFTIWTGIGAVGAFVLGVLDAGRSREPRARGCGPVDCQRPGVDEAGLEQRELVAKPGRALELVDGQRR